MKARSEYFKQNICLFGRELDSIITYKVNGVTQKLGSEELYSVTPVLSANLLKSVMKELDLESSIDIPIGTLINYKFGVRTSEEWNEEDEESNYDYISFGNYIVFSSEKQEDTGNYKIVCYDKMLYSMKDYKSLNIEFPTTIRSFLNALCNRLGITFANNESEFTNYDKLISNELYLDENKNSLGYSYRDVLDELAQVTASNICINEQDELEVRYINDTGEVIDEMYLKDTNVNFGEIYGPVNTIDLSRSADSDIISKSFPENLSDEEKVAIKIIDNQIMNGNNRDEFLTPILERLAGLSYYVNDFSSTGICYLDLCDKYNIKIGDKVYPCILLNDEINITQGLDENIFTDKLEESKTDYTKTDETDRRINQTYIIADKLKQLIDATIINVEGNTEQITQILQSISNILLSVQQSGGNNLIKNSVGFAGTIEWDLTYDNEETSTINTQSSVELLENGISGGAFLINGVKISQDIVVAPNSDYCFSCKVSKKPYGTGYVKIYNPGVETQVWLKELNVSELLDFEEIKFDDIKITGNTLRVEFYGQEGTNLTITDAMINRGDLSSIWTQANGEILNTQVNITSNGMLVKSVQFDENGQYVTINPLEFAGYAKKNGVQRRVFTVNGDTTIVNKIRSEEEIAMKPIKIVPILGTQNDGWAFVNDTGGVNNG